MCNRESWRSFTAQRVNGDLYAVQQCTSCGSHRLVPLSDAPLIGTGIEQSGEPDSDGTDDVPSW
jgi:hypothetical protein